MPESSSFIVATIASMYFSKTSTFLTLNEFQETISKCDKGRFTIKEVIRCFCSENHFQGASLGASGVS